MPALWKTFQTQAKKLESPEIHHLLPHLPGQKPF
jgi:hypothetical protein